MCERLERINEIEQENPELFNWLYNLSWVDFVNVCADIYSWTEELKGVIGEREIRRTQNTNNNK